MQQKFTSKFLILLLLAIAFATNLCAQVIYVNITATGANNGTSWGNAFTDFQAGVNAATSGQSVWVAKGTYQPYNDGDYYSMKSGVAIYGGFAGGETVLTARNFLTNITTLKGNDMSVIYNYGINSSAVLDGFTITGGNHAAGGGMLNTNSSPTINNVIFIKNVATTVGLGGGSGYGGGMYNSQSSPIITNVQFIQNNADDATGAGGGIYNANASSPRISNTQFTQNSANGDGGQGGGMYNNGNPSSPIISNTQFTQNTANGVNGKGGGMYSAGSLSLSISNVQFTQNTATGAGGEGGGMFNFNGYLNSISNVKFIANKANLKGGGFCDSTGGLKFNNITFYKDSVTSTNSVGGGMVEWGTYSIINNAVFLDNYSGSEGGGIYTSFGCNDLINNATFLGNLSVVKGNSIFNGGSVGFYSCLIWGNGTGTDPYNSATGIPTYTYSYCYAPITLAGSHSVISTTDPFLNSANPLGADGILGTADDGLQIATSSAAFNAGINSANTNTTDIAGNPRIKYVTIDMGAYENQGPAVIRWYVDSASTAGIKNGMNWANAFTTFQQATAVASSGDSIWVAKGTYQPPVNTSFSMKAGVAIYGGFAGSETLLTARNWFTNVTILKGNNNSVITSTGLTYSAVLDGFTITGGSLTNGAGMYNSNSSPTITNIQFIRNSSGFGGSGAGMYTSGGSPLITNVLFSLNSCKGAGEGGGLYETGASSIMKNVVFYKDSTAYLGGGIFEEGSSSKITNAIFSGNYSNGDGGGAIYIDGGSPVITNATFTGNEAPGDGTAVENNNGATSAFNNCVSWGNIYSNLKDFASYSSSPVYNYNYTKTGLGGTNTSGTSNPFVNSVNPAGADGIFGTADDGLAITASSVAFNTGSNTYISATDTTDIAGNTRIKSGTVDKGAFENQIAITHWYVDSASTAGVNNGGSWANAFTTFQQATATALSGDSIWVAKGTYQPPVNTAYTINNNVDIYGGFAGNESLLTARNWVTNHSILSGNNSNVIIDSGLNKTATFDGLTITDGKGSKGVGIYNLNSSPFITNCTFSANVGSSQGGAIYQDGGTLNITHNIFLQNKATGGGAVRANTVSGGSDPNAVIIGNIFYNNTSTFDDGGALSLVMGNGTDTIINNVFAQNISNTTAGNNNNGGAIVQENGTSSYIVNNTFYADTATSNSGAIRFKSGGSNRYLYNNLFYKSFNGTDNTEVSLAAGTTITAQSNNELSLVNPMFTNEANLQGTDGLWFTADDGLQLLGCSPAINVGSNYLNNTTQDIAGQTRIFNTTIDAGAYEYQSLPDGSSLALNTDTTNQTIYPGTEALITTGACRVIAKVLPDGANPLTGAVRSETYIDPAVQTYTGIPYVQRHFDITPSTGAATATAKVTLFVLQSEFDALNVISTVKLPTGPGDAAGIANVNVIQFHGTSATGTPGTYSGSSVIIDPNDADIIWNNTLNSWEISFDVTGFSGFIIVPVGGVPLSLNLLYFTGQLVNGKSQLQWQTADEINTDHFRIDKSIDKISFDSLSTIKAIGIGDNTYSTVDEQTQIGNNYYRLKLVNKDGSFTYSNTVLINKLFDDQINTLLVYPNPATNQLTVDYNNTDNAAIIIISVDGQKVLTTSTNGQIKTPVNISAIAAGTYFIEYRNNTQILRSKFVKIK
jgi:hypothetical protein